MTYTGSDSSDLRLYQRRDRSSGRNDAVLPQDEEMGIPDSGASGYCTLDMDCCVDNELNFKNIGRE